MTRPIRALGAGLDLVPELLLRQVILEGLVELAADRVRIDELFERVDSLVHNSGSVYLRDMRAAVEAMVPGGPGPGIAVRVGYPGSDAHWPVVSIVPERADEDRGGASMGDVLHKGKEIIGTYNEDAPVLADFKVYRYTVHGIDETVTLQVGSWTTVPEQSAALGAVVQHLIFRHKSRLVEAGVRDIDLSSSGFEPDPDQYPAVGYVPLLRCALSWTRRQTRRKGPVPVAWTLRPPTFSNE